MSGVCSDGVELVRIIARLNIGGPAIQAISLTRLMESRGYRTTLVRGSEDPDEGAMDDLAAELGVQPLFVPALRRNPGAHDLRALGALIRVIARRRPSVVHTHAAKAGTLGRVASLLAPGRRERVVVHTFHGHSLTGYFRSPTAAFYRLVERILARRTSCLIAISEEVRDELVRLRVAPSDRFEVVPLGFDLAPFQLDDATRARDRAALRAEFGIASDTQLVTLVARLVPIKRVDRFLRVATSLAQRPNVHFLVVGDGELRAQLEHSAEAVTLDGRLSWAGFRRDMPAVYAASDVCVLTSDNEGTPVSLIEALATSTSVVSTDVGGVAAVVLPNRTGLLVEAQDESGFVRAVTRLLDDPDLARELSRAGNEHVRASFDLQRLVTDLDRLYSRLLDEQRSGTPRHAVGQP